MSQRRGGARLRAAMGVLAVGALVGYVGVAGAAEPRADQTVQAISGTKWDKTTLAIETGDTVTWDINSGDNQPHNAEGVDGPDPSWNAKVIVPIGTTGTGSFRFTQPGTYTFLCRVHTTQMTGTITVTGAPVTPTATPSATATATATATASQTAVPQPTTSATPVPTVSNTINTPAPLGTSRADTVAPAISRFKLKAIKAGTKVSFALSEPSSVTIRVKRGKQTVGTVRLSARAGSRSLNLRRLAKGTYKVEIEARDARGNKAAVQRRTVKVKR